MEGVWEVRKGTYQAKEKLALIPNMMYMLRGEGTLVNTHQKEARIARDGFGQGWHGRAMWHGQTVPLCCPRLLGKMHFARFVGTFVLACFCSLLWEDRDGIPLEETSKDPKIRWKKIKKERQLGKYKLKLESEDRRKKPKLAKTWI